MSSVVVKFVDEAAVRRAMDEYAARLLADRPDVEGVVVFGSFADGTYAPGSDLDVFLRLSVSDKSVPDRIPDLRPRSFPVGVDLFPFTDAELVDRQDSPVVQAVRRSTWRYARGSKA